MENGKPVSGHTIKYHIEADGGVDRKGAFVTGETPEKFTLLLPEPGTVRSMFTLLGKDGRPVPLPPKKGRDQYRNVSALIGAAAEPEKIIHRTTAPRGFKEFWAKKRAELDALEIKELEKIKVRDSKGVQVYDVKISCTSKRPVSGCFAKPADAVKGKHPAIVFFHGAGVNSCSSYNVWKYALSGWITMELNAHGIKNLQAPEYYNDLKKGELHRYDSKLYKSREDYYMRDMYLRLMRALDYVKSHPEWNGKDLVVVGVSQGGLQAVIAGALDEKVSLIRAGVPSRADFYSEFHGDFKRMPRVGMGQIMRQEAKKHGYAAVDRMLEIHSWFDPVFFAPMIKGEVRLTAGGCDLSCPAASIYTIYNALSSDIAKNIIFYPSGTHATSTADPGAREKMNKIIAGCRAGFEKK